MTTNSNKRPHGRGPVVYLNRIRKAQMIEAIISDYRNAPIENKRILDIGCGNGDISSYFGEKNNQFGVDVSDRRKDSNSNFVFKQVDSEALPFEDNAVDIVITHHVIEQVSSHDKHIEEIKRVLK